MNGLEVKPFPSGIRLLIPIDTENNVITDVATESRRDEFMFLGVGDNPENYKSIDRNTPVEEESESEETL